MAGTDVSTYSYNKGCRCSGCKLEKRNQRLRKLNGEPPLPKRPPGAVWVDATEFTAVVRCERCDKNYGPWVLNPEGAVSFAQDHRALFHAGAEPFNWSKWSREQRSRNPSGRPPLDERPLCKDPLCTEPVHGKGLCSTHYKAASRKGLL